MKKIKQSFWKGFISSFTNPFGTVGGYVPKYSPSRTPPTRSRFGLEDTEAWRDYNTWSSKRPVNIYGKRTFNHMTYEEFICEFLDFTHSSDPHKELDVTQLQIKNGNQRRFAQHILSSNPKIKVKKINDLY